MKLLKKILLPVNPEYYTHDSIEFAIQIAKRYDSEIIPIHIISKEAEFEAIKEIALSLAKDHIKKVQSRISKEGLVVGVSIIEYGNHIDRISIAALRNNVNVILFGLNKPVMKGGIGLDLIIEKVIRHCDKPVWVVKEGSGKSLKNILCPVDFSDASKRALLNSIHLTQKFNANLTLLSVFTPVRIEFPWISKDLSAEHEASLQKYESRFESYVREFDFQNISWNSMVKTGKPDEVILEECINSKYDLIIMGSSGRTAFGRIMTGSVTEKVIRQVPCSFITTKSEDMINLQLETKIHNIELHYNSARQKQNLNLLDEAIGEYMICLGYNDMHIASIMGLAEIYKRKGMEEQHEFYSKMAKEIIERIYKGNYKLK